MTILFGGTVEQCRWFAHKHHMDQSKYKIITQKDDLYGQIHGTPIIFIGTWFENDNGTLDLAKSMGMMCLAEVK